MGHAYNVDCDLDNFAAAVGFARQAVLGLANDEGELSRSLQGAQGETRLTSLEIEIDVGDSSLAEGVYDPVQTLLDLVKSVKGPSR